MVITLKDGSLREFDEGSMPLIEIAGKISQGLKKSAVAAVVDGRVMGLGESICEDCSVAFLTFDDEEGRRVYRHTASHILAQAVKKLYPDVKLGIGPAVENGFYYDFDTPEAFTPDRLAEIEKEMQAIIKQNLRIERFELPRSEALALMASEPYKLELINELPEDAVISFYRQGEFVDLCAGPHLMGTGRVKAVKLLQCTGAYWRGSEKNKMLGRIYGTAFDDKAELAAHIEKLEEAKKRDHNRLGRELELFTTVDVIGQGLPIILPKGAKMIQIMQRWIEDLEESRGYLLTKTPLMAKADLYKISSHWDHYYDGMFVLGNKEMDERGEEVLALRPMTCPFQFQAYLNKTRSYRDLPMRFNESATLFRNEASGEMHGLIRVRQFTLAEGHLVVTPEQVEEEFLGVLDLVKHVMTTLGLIDDITYRFSKWDPNNRDKYIGSDEDWEKTQDTMRTILNKLNMEYIEAEGEAAFYGPKLDIQTRNVHGKEDTLITLQIDFQLAERFNMTYIDKDGQKKFPTVIHRSSIGCYERTLAMLIEKYAGAFPLWLSPVQARILTITDRGAEHARQVQRALQNAGLRVEVDFRNEKIGYKIREAQLEKIPYMLIIGDKEAEEGTVAVRSRKEGDLPATQIGDLVEKLRLEVAEMRI